MYLIGFLLLTFASLVFTTNYKAHAAQIQSGVIVNEAPASPPPTATCGLKTLSGVPINYGELNPQPGLGYMRSTDQTVVYSNIGNAAAKVMVKGSDWTGGTTSSPVTFAGPEWTHVSNASNVDWQNKMQLQRNEISLGQIEPGQTGQSYWQLQVPSTGVNGSLHQVVTLDLIC